MTKRSKGRFQRGDSVAPSPPERQWHYLDCPDQKGPYAESVFIELVRRGVVKPKHKVWTEGMDDWRPLVQSPMREHVPGEPPGPASEKHAGLLVRLWRKLRG